MAGRGGERQRCGMEVGFGALLRSTLRTMRGLLQFVGALALAYGVLTAWVFFTQRGQIDYPTP